MHPSPECCLPLLELRPPVSTTGIFSFSNDGQSSVGSPNSYIVRSWTDGFFMNQTLRVFHLQSCLHGSDPPPILKLRSSDLVPSPLLCFLLTCSTPLWLTEHRFSTTLSVRDPFFKRMIHFIDHFLPTSFPRFGRIGGTSLETFLSFAENDFFPRASTHPFVKDYL